MEIKNPLSMPLWVSQMLSKYKIRPYSFSKYGEVYKTDIIKEKNNSEVKVCSVQ